jgi:hypothetical protein
MSEATSGSERDTGPGFRFAHPGYEVRRDFQTAKTIPVIASNGSARSAAR